MTISSEKLPFRIKKHQSVLIRKLGVSDMQLQVNNVTNMKIARKRISGLLIKPGETFSFCKSVGIPAKRKGYLIGMELSFGKVRTGIGGGLCQIANSIQWLVLYSPLTVTERHHHSFDHFLLKVAYFHLEVVQLFFTIIWITKYRSNEIWRDKTDKFHSGKILQSEIITKNFAKGSICRKPIEK